MRRLLTHLMTISLIITIVLIPSHQTANILFYFTVSTYSHRIAAWPLVTSLASLGHNVTFMSMHPPKPEHSHVPNVTEFITNNDKLPQPDYKSLFNARLQYGRFGTIAIAASMPFMVNHICSELLSDQATLEWLAKSSYDLIIIDALLNDCGFGLAYKFKAKIILFSVTTVISWWTETFGLPSESNVISDPFIPFSSPLNLAERSLSTLIPLLEYWFRVWIYFPRLDTILREKLNEPNMPSVLELERDWTSLIFLSSHYAEEYPRALPPFVVPVGGIHMENGLQDSKGNDSTVDLSEISQWMDESGPEGFIYVSFGTAIDISEAPSELQNIFYTAFNHTRIRFLWKWESDARPAKMPSNVLVAKWMPQQKILSHPNIKAFISHGGYLGLLEAMAAGVPAIMFPIFADQDYHSFRYEAEGRGIRLELSTLRLETLLDALHEILSNPKYKESMRNAMKLYKDRPMSPLQTAIWWTEYVLRHDNNLTSSLKPVAAMHQSWAQRRSLDVWALIFGILLIALGIVVLELKKVLIYLIFRLSIKCVAFQEFHKNIEGKLKKH